MVIYTGADVTSLQLSPLFKFSDNGLTGMGRGKGVPPMSDVCTSSG